MLLVTDAESANTGGLEIPLEQAKAMINRYLDEALSKQFALFSDGSIPAATTENVVNASIWFSRELIVNLLSQDEKWDGIRVYFGVGSPEDELCPAQKLSTILVATANGGKDIGFDNDGKPTSSIKCDECGTGTNCGQARKAGGHDGALLLKFALQ